MNLERSFTAELLKIGLPTINRMGEVIPVPSVVPDNPWIMEELTSPNIKTRTIGNKFNIFLYLNQTAGIPLPYGFATFDVVEDGQTHIPGFYLSQRLIFSHYDLFSSEEQSHRVDMIKVQLEATAFRFARSIQEIAFQALFNGINS